MKKCNEMKILQLVIFVNGNVISFADTGELISEKSGNIHRLPMKDLIMEALIIELSEWGIWKHNIEKEQAIRLFVKNNN